jgi:hypothetical protein
LEDAVEGARELGFGGGLEADFYCVEGVSIHALLDMGTRLAMHSGVLDVETYPTLNFAMPENTPATKPL